MLLKYLNYNLFLPKINKYIIFISYICVLLIMFNWIQLFFYSWLSLIFLTLLYIYINSISLISYIYITILPLVIKSWYLLIFFWKNNVFLYYIIGDYSQLYDTVPITLVFFLDIYSISYISLTYSIGVWAILFAKNYMKFEIRIFTFISLLVFFLKSMVFLLSSGNFCTILLGWEMIGCFSFLLINFWSTRIATTKSAFKAFTFNKLSDLFLLIAFILNIYFIPSINLFSMNSILELTYYIYTISFLKINFLKIIILCIIIGSFCKSAQFGFHIWLPDSMEAPVPASALIHSATLVSAGIYLVGRINSIIYIIDYWNLLMLWCSFTAFYGGLIASYQTDLKRILAYSTISHCGFLFCSIFLNNIFITLIYLHFHGWFKSLSFMCSGLIISKNHNYQDFRKMGNYVSMSFFEYFILTISLLNLASIPFTIGFFNKHYFIALFWNNINLILPFIWLFFASLTGIFYSFKLLNGVFWGSYKNTFFCKNEAFNSIYSNRVFFTNQSNSNIFFLINFVITISLSSIIFLIFFTNTFKYTFIIHSNWDFIYPFIYLMFILIFFRKINFLILIIFIKFLYVL